MNEQSRSRPSYPYDNEERRSSALPSLNASLQTRDSYASELAAGAAGARQAHIPSSYTHTGPVSHTPYDPVHDAYDYSRMASPGVAQPPQGFLPTGYPRAEHSSDMYNYRDGNRFNNMDTLPPIKHTQHYEHASQAPTHEIGGLHHQPAYPPRADSGYEAYHMQTDARPGGTQFPPQQGLHQTARGDGQSTSYNTLPPLSIPGERPSSSDGKGGAKRIVMACHQCRQRKIKCDAVRPACGNCVRRREECGYDVKPKRRGPDKVPGSRMRSCKSRKQGMGEESPSATSAGFQSPSSSTFFSSPT